MKTSKINIRISDELKQAIAEARKKTRPTESETAFVERACWERIERIERTLRRKQ